MQEAREKFSEIYDENVDKVYRFIFLKVNSKEIAEDLTAETFTKVWKTFNNRFKKKRALSNPRAFSYRTARNLIIDHYRKKGRQDFVPTDSVVLIDNNQSLEERAMINSDMENVMKGIKEIKDNYQDIIIWHYLDELSVSEISEIMGKSENSVRVTLHRAIDSLKNVLEA
jgi:RNA polymerase sigma-70 factor, ECF subfamily